MLLQKKVFAKALASLEKDKLIIIPAEMLLNILKKEYDLEIVRATMYNYLREFEKKKMLIRSTVSGKTNNYLNYRLVFRIELLPKFFKEFK